TREGGGRGFMSCWGCDWGCASTAGGSGVRGSEFGATTTCAPESSAPDTSTRGAVSVDAAAGSVVLRDSAAESYTATLAGSSAAAGGAMHLASATRAA